MAEQTEKKEMAKEMAEEKNAFDKREVAIRVSDVTKIYKLYKSPGERFKESMGLSKKKRFKTVYALDKVSFNVHKGECVGIIGTNGSGKSTILKIITGVLSPTSGTIEVNGKISALLELGAGFNMEYTGRENIYVNGTINGFSREQIDARVDDIIKFADIGEFIDQPVKTYSSGMFVRLAFAVAINIDPEILIVDEALSVGDVFFQAKCYRKFEEFKKEGKTILFVSHDLGAVQKYCDTVVLLNKGVKKGEGSSKKMVDAYKKLVVENNEAKQAKTHKENKKLGRVADHYVTDLGHVLMRNPDTEEYGEGQAEIRSIRVFDANGRETNSIDKHSDFTMQLKVHFNEDIAEPIFAYTIKNARGTELCGTNTMYDQTKGIRNIKKGEDVTIEFKQNMALQGSDYLLSFGCTGYIGADFHVFHRLYDVCSITVLSQRNTSGYFDMFSKISVKRDLPKKA